MRWPGCGASGMSGWPGWRCWWAPAGERQSVPLSKGDPALAPARSGRKSGEAHGRHGHRPIPPTVDRELDALSPGCCRGCGADVEFERWPDQFQSELPDPAPVVTRSGSGSAGVGRAAVGCRAAIPNRPATPSAPPLPTPARRPGAWATGCVTSSGCRSPKWLGFSASRVSVTAGAFVGRAFDRDGAGPHHQGHRERAAAASDIVMGETGWRVGGVGGVAVGGDHPELHRVQGPSGPQVRAGLRPDPRGLHGHGRPGLVGALGVTPEPPTRPVRLT